MNSNDSTKSKKIDMYVNEYSTYSNNKKGTLLDLSHVVSQAKNDLSTLEFNKFCNLVGLKSHSTRIKMKMIGDRYSIFKEYLDQIPLNWTSVYKLTMVPIDELVKYFQEGLIHQTIKGKEIDYLVNQTSIDSQKNKPQNKNELIRINLKIDPNWTESDKNLIGSLILQIRNLGGTVRSTPHNLIK